ncbi:hypothetical protein E2C01_030865 [Portunus trituberculatus]|uniref:Uncharacterized protein n=1 Tax=Portunus trituberculatus TaxID=210409 RepID=A0A5B7ERJ7_PORTR|nr:hypothetical protein [Portunus trituberculatus]
MTQISSHTITKALPHTFPFHLQQSNSKATEAS